MLLARPAGEAAEAGGQAHLEVRHGHAVVHVVTCSLDGLEEVSQGPQVDAGLRVHAQHRVGLPRTCGTTGYPLRGCLSGAQSPADVPAPKTTHTCWLERANPPAAPTCSLSIWETRGRAEQSQGHPGEGALGDTKRRCTGCWRRGHGTTVLCPNSPQGVRAVWRQSPHRPWRGSFAQQPLPTPSTSTDR